MAQFLRSAINDLTYTIIAAAIEVHRALGPGLLESAYQACMALELSERRLAFESEKRLPLDYKGMRLDRGFKIDLLVEETAVVELKCVRTLAPVHHAQLLTYLKLTGTPVGLLINFNVPIVRTGIKRLLNKDHDLVDDLTHAQFPPRHP
jgi:GxxExxY protein